ncbi:MAG: hypothetical protein Q7U57_17450 [Methylovulum sp.]|nr:hypothetical protein [Methylovulum sp.]
MLNKSVFQHQYFGQILASQHPEVTKPSGGLTSPSKFLDRLQVSSASRITLSNEDMLTFTPLEISSSSPFCVVQADQCQSPLWPFLIFSLKMTKASLHFADVLL